MGDGAAGAGIALRPSESRHLGERGAGHDEIRFGWSWLRGRLITEFGGDAEAASPLGEGEERLPLGSVFDPHGCSA